MIFNKNILKQKAQNVWWFCLLSAFVIAGFALLFLPIAVKYRLVCFVALVLISYFLVRKTVGFDSSIKEVKKGVYALAIRDNEMNNNSYLPLEYITDIEVCEYFIGQKNKIPSKFKNQPNHRIFNQFFYQGLGLVVGFQLPKHISADTSVKSWQFPAPKANDFILFISKYGLKQQL